MDKTSFQVMMEPHAHSSLKTKANMFKITIGEMVVNLLATLEYRVKKVQEQIEKDGVSITVARDGATEKRIIELILKRDMDELTARQFKAEIKRLTNDLSGETITTPELKLKGIGK